MNAQQLKNAILQEAIEGRLVPQDPNDEPASALLERIRKEKEELVKAGKLKKKDLEVKPISEDEIPFEIPESWEWCRVGDIFIHASGKQQSSNNKNVGTLQKYITTSNLYWGKFVLDTLKEMYFTDEELKTCSAQKGDLLVCEGGAGYGRSAIWPYEYDICLQNHVHRLRPVINGVCEYVFYLIYLLKESNRLASVGTAMPGLSANRLKELFVPLPPLAEQHRIVAKIEELLPKVEEYGKAQDALNKLNAELPERLKKSILQEAISGRLVPQDPNDEPASVLLDKIRKEKEQLVKEGKLKKKDLIETPIIEDEIPFEIPESWEWCRLKSFVQFINGDRGKNYPSKDKLVENGEIPFISAINIEGNSISPNGLLYVSQKQYDALSQGKLHNNDVVLCIRGSLGKAAIYPFEKGAIASSLVILRNIGETYNKYLIYYLNTPLFFSQINSNDNGTAQPNLSADNVANFYVPLPPLAEQHRIVEKLEQVLGEIDKLKK